MPTARPAWCGRPGTISTPSGSATNGTATPSERTTRPARAVGPAELKAVAGELRNSGITDFAKLPANAGEDSVNILPALRGEKLPQPVRDTFVVSGDVTAEEHVRMQGALQAFVDNSLSKTVNFPEGATEEDVATAYMLAWELGALADNATGTPGTDFDQIGILGGDLSVPSTAVLEIAFLGGVSQFGDTVIDQDSLRLTLGPGVYGWGVSAVPATGELGDGSASRHCGSAWESGSFTVN